LLFVTSPQGHSGDHGHHARVAPSRGTICFRQYDSAPPCGTARLRVTRRLKRQPAGAVVAAACSCSGCFGRLLPLDFKQTSAATEIRRQITPFASPARPSGRGYFGPVCHLTGAGTSNRPACQLHATVSRRVIRCRTANRVHPVSAPAEATWEASCRAQPHCVPTRATWRTAAPTANRPGPGGAQKAGAARSPDTHAPVPALPPHGAGGGWV
jgi:hypothetical protein